MLSIIFGCLNCTLRVMHTSKHNWKLVGFHNVSVNIFIVCRYANASVVRVVNAKYLKLTKD